jgi:hypothetical protein
MPVVRSEESLAARDQEAAAFGAGLAEVEGCDADVDALASDLFSLVAVADDAAGDSALSLLSGLVSLGAFVVVPPERLSVL